MKMFFPEYPQGESKQKQMLVANVQSIADCRFCHI